MVRIALPLFSPLTLFTRITLALPVAVGLTLLRMATASSARPYPSNLQRRLYLHGVLMFGPLGLVCIGLTTAMGLMANYRAGVGAHIQAVVNGTWTVAVGAMIPRLQLSDRWLRVMYYMLMMGTYPHFLAYMGCAILGGKFDILALGTSTQEAPGNELYKMILSCILLGPVTIGMIGHALILCAGLWTEEVEPHQKTNRSQPSDGQRAMYDKTA